MSCISITSGRALDRPDVAGKQPHALQLRGVHGSSGCLRVAIPARELTQVVALANA